MTTVALLTSGEESQALLGPLSAWWVGGPLTPAMQFFDVQCSFAAREHFGTSVPADFMVQAFASILNDHFSQPSAEYALHMLLQDNFQTSSC
jgi:hypothetical protein